MGPRGFNQDSPLVCHPSVVCPRVSDFASLNLQRLIYGGGGTMIVISKALFRIPKCGEGLLHSRSSENSGCHCCQGGERKDAEKEIEAVFR